MLKKWKVGLVVVCRAAQFGQNCVIIIKISKNEKYCCNFFSYLE